MFSNSSGTLENYKPISTLTKQIIPHCLFSSTWKYLTEMEQISNILPFVGNLLCTQHCVASDYNLSRQCGHWYTHKVLCYNSSWELWCFFLKWLFISQLLVKYHTFSQFYFTPLGNVTGSHDQYFYLAMVSVK